MQKAKLLLVLAAPFVLFASCKKEDEAPPPQTPAPYPQQPYGQPAPAPTPQPTATAPAPGPSPTATQPAPAGTMSQPSPMALPCTADANCLTHRCNTQFGKCAWPCQGPADCNPGNNCMGGACVPGAAPAPQ